MRPYTDEERDEFRAKYQDARWQKMKSEVYRRDDWSCRGCGMNCGVNGGAMLHAHHTYYGRQGRDPWDYPLASIVTLCEECHAHEHANWEIRWRLQEAACANGFWSVYTRDQLAHALAGVTDAESGLVIEMVERFVASLHTDGGRVAHAIMRALDPPKRKSNGKGAHA